MISHLGTKTSLKQRGTERPGAGKSRCLKLTPTKRLSKSHAEHSPSHKARVLSPPPRDRSSGPEEQLGLTPGLSYSQGQKYKQKKLAGPAC